VPNGDIRVGFYFAEIAPDGAGVGKRVFNVLLNGETAFDHLDIFARAGANTAYHEDRDIAVTDGKVRIAFENIAHHAKISAIEISRPPIAYRSEAPYRIDCGAEDDYYDAEGNGWQADSHWNGGATAYAAVPVAGTADAPLFASERWADASKGTLSYDFDLKPGEYRVRLHFAEPWDIVKGVGKRVFNVRLNGKTILDRFDIFAAAGYAKAIVKEFPLAITAPEGGKAVLEFENVVHEAKIDAIEILPEAASALRPARMHARAPDGFHAKSRDALGRAALPAAVPRR
jgi:hypothetical protein